LVELGAVIKLLVELGQKSLENAWFCMKCRRFKAEKVQKIPSEDSEDSFTSFSRHSHPSYVIQHQHSSFNLNHSPKTSQSLSQLHRPNLMRFRRKPNTKFTVKKNFFTARSNFMRKSSKNYDKKREKLHNTAYENIK
jgi:hypothetical protein